MPFGGKEITVRIRSNRHYRMKGKPFKSECLPLCATGKISWANGRDDGTVRGRALFCYGIPRKGCFSFYPFVANQFYSIKQKGIKP